MDVSAGSCCAKWEVQVLAGPGRQEIPGVITPVLQGAPPAHGEHWGWSISPAVVLENNFALFFQGRTQHSASVQVVSHTNSFYFREAVTFMNFCGWCRILSQLSYFLSSVRWETRVQLAWWCIPVILWFVFFPNPMRFVLKDLFGEICCITGLMLLNRSGWISAISPETQFLPPSISPVVFSMPWHLCGGESITGVAALASCVGWISGVWCDVTEAQLGAFCIPVFYHIWVFDFTAT